MRKLFYLAQYWILEILLRLIYLLPRIIATHKKVIRLYWYSAERKLTAFQIINGYDTLRIAHDEGAW